MRSANQSYGLARPVLKVSCEEASAITIGGTNYAGSAGIGKFTQPPATQYQLRAIETRFPPYTFGDHKCNRLKITSRRSVIRTG
jgi:hypothetical protein